MAVGLDTETALATNEEPVPRLVSVAIADAGGAAVYAAHDPKLPGLVRDAYAEGVAIANAPFDGYVLLRAFPDLLPDIVEAYEQDRVFDVLTRENLVDIAEGRPPIYGLGAVAKRRAGIELDKNDPWRKRYAELLGLKIEQWPEEARAYALADGVAHFEVWAAQERFRAEHSIDVFADAGRQARGHFALYAQTLRGIRTDPERVAARGQALAERTTRAAIACLDAGLARIGGTKARPKVQRTKAAAAAMLEQWCAENGLRPRRTNPTTKFPLGQIKLDEDALAAARVPEGHPLDAYRVLGAVGSTLTKHEVLKRPIVRTRYQECVASGRTSSSGPQGRRKLETVESWEWVGSNLQNQEQKGGARECLIPPPGHVFVSSDWSGAELVTLAQVQIDLFGRSALGDMLRAGRDPHSEFGARMLGIPAEDFNRYDEGEHAKARQGGKAWNFGKPGGMGKARFIAHALKTYGVAITEDEEREHTRSWHAMLPEMRMFFEYVRKLEGSNGYFTVVQPRSGRIRGGMRFPDACNTHFQGLAADAAKTALWRLWRASLDPHSPLFGHAPAVSPTGNVPLCGQSLFVHDENVTVARREDAEAVKAEQEKIMIESFAAWCPDVPIKVETTIAERYTK